MTKFTTKTGLWVGMVSHVGTELVTIGVGVPIGFTVKEKVDRPQEQNTILSGTGVLMQR
jgi:hypothetical protein